MPFHDAVCIQCGSWKRVALEGCNHCHHVPVLDEDKAKSVYLSIAVVHVLSQSENSYKFEGTYEDLLDAQATIRSGGSFQYEEQLLHEVNIGVKESEANGSRFTIFAICVILISLAVFVTVIWLLLQ